MKAPRWIFWIFVSVSALQLLPVWLSPFLPTGDGPAHVYGAWLARELTLGRLGPPIISYYHVDWHPLPNWTATLFMGAALTIAPPLVAEKLFVSLIIVAFAAGAWLFATCVNHDNAPFAFLALPLIFNQILLAGFYNFALGVGLLLVTAGYYVRHVCTFSNRQSVILGFLLLLCYFTHPMSALLAIGTMLFVSVPAVTRANYRHHLTAAAAATPAGVLLLWFLHRQPSLSSPAHYPLDRLIAYLTRTELIDTFDSRQVLFGRAFFALLVCLLVATILLERSSLWKRRDRLGLLLFAVAVTVTYFVAPAESAGGAAVNERLALFAVLLPIPVLSARAGRTVRVQLVVVLSIVGLINAGFQLHHFRDCSRKLQRFLAATESIPPRSVVLPILFTRQMPGAYIGYHVHAIEYVAIEKELVDLGYYQPGTEYFPIRFNASIKRPAILQLEGQPASVNLDDYSSAAYVFAWRMPAESTVRRQLEQRFVLRASANGGELYQRRSTAPTARNNKR